MSLTHECKRRTKKDKKKDKREYNGGHSSIHVRTVTSLIEKTKNKNIKKINE